MPEDTYRKSWNRQNRGLLIFLLDQSISMQQTVLVGKKAYTNGQMATLILNDLIVSVIRNTPPDAQRGGRKDYCDIFVLGYGDKVRPLLADARGLPVSIRELDKNPKGSRPVLVERFDRAQGKHVQTQETQPYWVEYVADGVRTEMAKALQTTWHVTQNWLNADPKRSQSFPPIIVNITDGDHNGEGDPVEEATRLRHLFTNDGHALLFNCHLTSTGQQQSLVFPKTIQQIDAQISNSDERDWARQLFAMSSLIPATMVKKARTSFNTNLEFETRGFIYNSSLADLIDFLKWGTQPGDNLGR